MKKLYTEDNQLIEISDEFYELSKTLKENSDLDQNNKIWERWDTLHKQYQVQYNTDSYYIQFALWDHFDNCNALVE